MLNILECKIIEENHHQLKVGEKVQVTTRLYRRSDYLLLGEQINHARNLPVTGAIGVLNTDHNYKDGHLKKYNSKVKDSTDYQDLWSYVLEEKATGRLIALKVGEKVDKSEWETVFVGLRNTNKGEEIVVYSTDKITESDYDEISNKKESIKTVYKSDMKDISIMRYMPYIVWVCAFLFPFGVISLNWGIVFKGVFKKEFEGYQVNMIIVKVALLFFAAMPIYAAYKMFVGYGFNLTAFCYSSAFWGFVSWAFLFGGKVILDIKNNNEIKKFNEEIKK